MRLLPEEFNNISIAGGQAPTPSKTYRMNIEEEMVSGIISKDLEAVRQAVYKILNTERYKHVIYSSDYGVELADLFGKPMPYVIPEIPRRIEEALLVDDRITKVDSFDLQYDKQGNVNCYFVVHSIFGNIEMERSVKVKNV